MTGHPTAIAPRSVTDHPAILAHFGGAPVNLMLRVVLDRFVAAERTGAGFDQVDFVAALFEFGREAGIETRFQLHRSNAFRGQSSRRGVAEMPPACRVAGFLHIHPEVD